MKSSIYVIGAMLLILSASCGNSKSEKAIKAKEDSLRRQVYKDSKPVKEQFAATVKQAEERMKAAKSASYDAGIANALIKSYLDYANAFPNDTLSPDYIFRSAEIASSGGSYDQALILFKSVTDKYSRYKYVVEALYEEAMIYDSKLPGQTEKARIIYQQIIDDYPKHKLAEDAKIAIANLGKTDEQLVKEFEKKNHLK
jgi:TolA-binding protein